MAVALSARAIPFCVRACRTMCTLRRPSLSGLACPASARLTGHTQNASWLEAFGCEVTTARALICHIASLGMPSPQAAFAACIVALVATRVDAGTATSACAVAIVPGEGVQLTSHVVERPGFASSGCGSGRVGGDDAAEFGALVEAEPPARSRRPGHRYRQVSGDSRPAWTALPTARPWRAADMQ